ncbi:hypothetical protein BaRGS_00025852 [Batillaria attramentaria]|uniref:Uncharacterized protein n=1 Tax=Batillaria attramentaria TaxID=370345 RepID=A0ABD0K761_9CAEN
MAFAEFLAPACSRRIFDQRNASLQGQASQERWQTPQAQVSWCFLTGSHLLQASCLWLSVMAICCPPIACPGTSLVARNELVGFLRSSCTGRSLG